MALTLLVALAGAARAQSVSADSNGACWDYGAWFDRVGPEWGVRGYGRSLGVNLSDFDGDGLTDIYVAMAPSRAEGAAYYPGEDLVYLQNADGTFREAGAELGLQDLCEDRAPLRGDLDGDGLADLYVTVNGRSVVYHDDQSTYFDDVTAWSGAAGHVGWGHQGFLLDYDKDGWLDIFYTNGPEDGSGPNTLLQNQRDGTFRDVSADAGVEGDPSGKGTCVLDADLDGWDDIFVTTGREFGNHLFMNQRDGTFQDEALARGVSDPLQRFGVGADCGDLDNDGDPDILVVTHDKRYTGNQLFRNDGGVFSDVAGDASDDVSAETIQERVDGHGSALVDLDMDGDLDVILSGFGFTPHVYLNQGDLVFRRACDGLGITAADMLSWGVVSSDLTGDGYPEVYISNGLGLRPRDDELFEYIGPTTNHWLGVDVVGTTHNASAIGAKVEVEVGNKTITRWIGSWSSFDSQGTLTAAIGMGSATIADAVKVTFTNGTVVTETHVAADQRIHVAEPTSHADVDHDGVPDDWDECPGTWLGRTTDGEGCAIGQRGGLAVALSSPVSNDVITDCFTFRWEGASQASAVVQISADGTFGPAERIDLGPTTRSEYEVCGDDLDLLRSTSDGSTPFVWRVALADEDGNAAVSLPAPFYVALPTAEVTTPLGANVFEPAHIVVTKGTTVSWWNSSASAGNLQSEAHDVQLVDATGSDITEMHEFDSGGTFTYTFPEAGVWHYICAQHSGAGTPSDAVHETNAFHHHPTEGPYRCMAGTVTVQ